MNKMNTDILLNDMKRLYSIRNDVSSVLEDTNSYSESEEQGELKNIMEGIENAANELKTLIFTKGAFYERG